MPDFVTQQLMQNANQFAQQAEVQKRASDIGTRATLDMGSRINFNSRLAQYARV